VHESGPKQGEPNRRRRWHPACLKTYEMSDPGVLRRRVQRRDRGRCRACGLDTKALSRRVRGRGRVAKLRALGFLPRRSLWELDHVIPLIDGGSHEPTNLQTLCAPCHRQKTAQETRERAVRARLARTGEGSERRADEPPPAPRRRSGAAREAADMLDEELSTLLSRADSANARAEAALARVRSGTDVSA